MGMRSLVGMAFWDLSHRMHCVPLIRASPIRSAQHGRALGLQGQKSYMDLLRHHSHSDEVSMSEER